MTAAPEAERVFLYVSEGDPSIAVVATRGLVAVTAAWGRATKGGDRTIELVTTKVASLDEMMALTSGRKPVVSPSPDLILAALRALDSPP